MFGKKKKEKINQQLADFKLGYQTLIEQALQFPTPLDQYERLGEIKHDLAAQITAVKPFALTDLMSLLPSVAGVSMLLEPVMHSSPLLGGLGLIVAIPALTVQALSQTGLLHPSRKNPLILELSATIAKQQENILTQTPLEKMQTSPQFKALAEQNPILQKRIIEEFTRVSAPDYKKPLFDKQKLSKDDKGFDQSR